MQNPLSDGASLGDRLDRPRRARSRRARARELAEKANREQRQKLQAQQEEENELLYYVRSVMLTFYEPVDYLLVKRLLASNKPSSTNELKFKFGVPKNKYNRGQRDYAFDPTYISNKLFQLANDGIIDKKELVRTKTIAAQGAEEKAALQGDGGEGAYKGNYKNTMRIEYYCDVYKFLNTTLFYLRKLRDALDSRTHQTHGFRCTTCLVTCTEREYFLSGVCRKCGGKIERFTTSQEQQPQRKSKTDNETNSANNSMLNKTKRQRKGKNEPDKREIMLEAVNELIKLSEGIRRLELKDIEKQRDAIGTKMKIAYERRTSYFPIDDNDAGDMHRGSQRGGLLGRSGGRGVLTDKDILEIIQQGCKREAECERLEEEQMHPGTGGGSSYREPLFNIFGLRGRFGTANANDVDATTADKEGEGVTQDAYRATVTTLASLNTLSTDIPPWLSDATRDALRVARLFPSHRVKPINAVSLEDYCRSHFPNPSVLSIESSDEYNSESSAFSDEKEENEEQENIRRSVIADNIKPGIMRQSTTPLPSQKRRAPSSTIRTRSSSHV